MRAYRQRGGKQRKIIFLGILCRPFQPQPEAAFTAGAAFSRVLQSCRRLQKLLGGNRILHHCHVPAERRFRTQSPQLCQSFSVLLRLGDVWIAEKQRNGKVPRQIFQHIRGARRTAGVQQKRRALALPAQSFYCPLSLLLIVPFFHCCRLFPYFCPYYATPAAKRKEGALWVTHPLLLIACGRSPTSHSGHSCSRRRIFLFSCPLPV